MRDSFRPSILPGRRGTTPKPRPAGHAVPPGHAEDERVDDAAAAAGQGPGGRQGQGSAAGHEADAEAAAGVPEPVRSKDGRDPKLLGDQMDRLLVDRAGASTLPSGR